MDRVRKSEARRRPVIRSLTAAVFLATVAGPLAVILQSGIAQAVTGAAFTTVNEGVDGTGHCQNGNPNINCNIYDGKEYVWLNGGPAVAYLGDGTYFFAVLDPGGQNDPNDGSANNLSDDFDAYTNRTFAVSGAAVTYSGSHAFDSNKIRLADYADTSDPGGVYILAICSLGTGYPVQPSSCKYDAFKIQASGGGAAFDLSITKDAAGADTNTFTWGIAKDVDRTRITDSTGSAEFNYSVSATHDAGTISAVTVTGTIQVFNPNADNDNNTLAVDINEVSDQLSDGTVCAVGSGGPQTLSTFETDFTYTCDLTALPQGELNNTAVVSWPEQTLSDGSSLADGSAPFTFSNIAFTETKVDDCASVTDTLGGTLGLVCSTDASPTTFTYSKTFNDPAGTCINHDNTAMFTTDDTGATNSASQTVTQCVGADLTVSKGAKPTFDRSYGWSITKDVDKTLVEQFGGTATFNYTVKVKHGAASDSHWQVTGSIVVKNPNDWEAITADVTDAVDNGGTCTVTGGTGVSIAASGSATLAYTCTYASAPSPKAGTNTATATWDAGASFTPHGAATGNAAFTFDDGTTGNPKLIDNCVAVTDTFGGTLGSPCATSTSPETFTYKYSKTVNVPANNCAFYNNTATFTTNTTGTTGSASQKVEVCGPAKTGALTMGFWQNKNGQGIITGGKSTGGVCNSGTWLRQYKPFQDLSTTATCAQVATYVANVIKGGGTNCGGTTCNAMLKAQMLATALDVYFSDAALGGNKISAPGPLGGVPIDLTNICHMIDGSGGSATCSGTFENVSSAFGGATSLTVSQMLAYAASQSNVGGSVWYGQVKATQVLAKDAFDAINNAVAFSP